MNRKIAKKRACIIAAGIIDNALRSGSWIEEMFEDLDDQYRFIDAMGELLHELRRRGQK